MTPEQAEKRLVDLASQLQRHLNAPDKAGVPEDLAQWFIDAVMKRKNWKKPKASKPKAVKAKTKRKRKAKQPTIGQALGTERGPGTPSGKGQSFDLALEIFNLKPDMSWLELQSYFDRDTKELRETLNRYLPEILRRISIATAQEVSVLPTLSLRERRRQGIK